MSTRDKIMGIEEMVTCSFSKKKSWKHWFSDGDLTWPSSMKIVRNVRVITLVSSCQLIICLYNFVFLRSIMNQHGMFLSLNQGHFITTQDVQFFFFKLCVKQQHLRQLSGIILFFLTNPRLWSLSKLLSLYSVLSLSLFNIISFSQHLV